MVVGYAVSRILDTYPNLDPKEVERQLGHGSFASLKDRFVYLEVPKAACTTMKSLLRQLYGSGPLRFPDSHRETRRHMFVHARNNSPLPALTTLKERDQREILEAKDVLRFIIVRNPYARLVSAWRDKVYLCEPTGLAVYTDIRGAVPTAERKIPILFPEFVSYLERTGRDKWDHHWRRQVDNAFPKALDLTHIGRTEDFVSTVEVFRRHLRRPQPIPIPRANEAAINPPPDYSEEIAGAFMICTKKISQFLATPPTLGRASRGIARVLLPRISSSPRCRSATS